LQPYFERYVKIILQNRLLIFRFAKIIFLTNIWEIKLGFLFLGSEW
jgi:hypothetical protein